MFAFVFVQAEFATIERELEDEEKARRRRAIIEGRPLPAKRSILQEVQAEEWEYIKGGLETIGAQKRPME